MQRSIYGLLLIQVFLLGVPALAQQKDDQSENQRLRQEVEQMKEERKQDRERIKRLEDIVDKLTKEKPSAPPPAPTTEKPPAKEKGQEALEREVEEFLKQSGTGKQGAAPGAAPSTSKPGVSSSLSLGLSSQLMFNPEISVIGDVLFHDNSSGTNADLGSGKFLFRELELAFSQVVDPFARGDAFISIGEDPHYLGKFDIDIEEDYMTLLTLPYD